MCGIAEAGLALTAVSMAMGAVGQFQQQRAQEKSAKSAAEYNAQVAANEAATQRQLAQNEIAKGAAERSQQQRQAARAMGEMRANMGASGFQMDTGSMISLLDESAAEHQYDSSVISSNANQAAWQHMVGVTNANNNANFANWQGKNASSGRLGTFLGMGGTLLGGVASGLNSYDKWKQTKTPGKNVNTNPYAGANPFEPY